MKKTVVARGRLIFLPLCIGLVLWWGADGLAQLDKISISLSGGAGYLPLNDWEDFATSISSSHFEKDKFGTYSELRVAYHLAGKHAIALNVESINISASAHIANALTGPFGDTSGYASSVIEWDFSAVPIGLSYEFRPTGSEESVTPFLGAGASYFFSKLEFKSYFLHDGRFADLSSEGTRDGEGYGLHLYVGVQSEVTKHFFIISRLRGRYSDGMAFTDEEEDVKVEFTGFDFTLGFGWRF